jgi:hypothetical protein
MVLERNASVTIQKYDISTLATFLPRCEDSPHDPSQGSSQGRRSALVASAQHELASPGADIAVSR